MGCRREGETPVEPRGKGLFFVIRSRRRSRSQTSSSEFLIPSENELALFLAAHRVYPGGGKRFD